MNLTRRKLFGLAAGAAVAPAAVLAMPVATRAVDIDFAVTPTVYSDLVCVESRDGWKRWRVVRTYTINSDGTLSVISRERE